VLRDFTGGTGRDRVPGKDFEDEPLIAVSTATLSGALGDVQAGEALQRVLLTASWLTTRTLRRPVADLLVGPYGAGSP
jgi:hypothetical protein